jgi:hypothetical protein
MSPFPDLVALMQKLAESVWDTPRWYQLPDCCPPQPKSGFWWFLSREFKSRPILLVPAPVEIT